MMEPKPAFLMLLFVSVVLLTAQKTVPIQFDMHEDTLTCFIREEVKSEIPGWVNGNAQIQGYETISHQIVHDSIFGLIGASPGSFLWYSLNDSCLVDQIVVDSLGIFHSTSLFWNFTGDEVPEIVSIWQHEWEFLLRIFQFFPSSLSFQEVDVQKFDTPVHDRIYESNHDSLFVWVTDGTEIVKLHITLDGMEIQEQEVQRKSILTE